jgi:hypothetical protein
MHLIRLMRMGLEALEHGDLAVRRHDAAELAAIRDGALRFDALRQLADDLRGRMIQAAEHTALPEGIDHEWLDELAMRMMTA